MTMMNRIFIESKKKETPESNFLKAVLERFFSEKEYSISFLDGVANLFNSTNVNQMRVDAEEMINDIVIVDADTTEKQWGFSRRFDDINNNRTKLSLNFSLFLFPNNEDDGDLEVLLESLVQRDKHKLFFDCFQDYESCVSCKKDSDGKPMYIAPNRKGKLFTYISSMRMNRSCRNKLGQGDWQFLNEDYWSMDSPGLKPLISFLKVVLK